MQVRIKIDPHLAIKNEVSYLFRIFGQNKLITCIEASDGIEIGATEGSRFRISDNFIANYTQQRFSFSENLDKNGFITLPNGEVDYISTAFYMLASLQEYDAGIPKDALGRFQYKNSYQSKLNLASANLVQQCFDKIAERMGVPQHSVPARLFLSHDIDNVYDSILQDGFYALKKGRLDIILKLLFNVAIGKPDWLNIDQIMNIESEYDCRSTFFWIVKKGMHDGLKNSDYNFSSPKIQKNIQDVEQRGFENGIHKSISPSSFQEELAEFRSTPISNRYHYLKFNLPTGYDAIEECGLKMDATLGFAENIGFRNSYGLPFTPYNVSKKQPYSFVEVPLHVMDTTLFKYQRSNSKDAEKAIFEFFSQNQTNTVLSVLWHNNFFSNYKYNGYLALYKKILAYMKENKFNTISQAEIIKQYAL